MNHYRIGLINYLNALPLTYNLEKQDFIGNHTLIKGTPSELYRQLYTSSLDIALVSSATLNDLPNAQIISRYGIAAHGRVQSVGIFAHQPLESLSAIYSDPQSKTSVLLLQILLKQYWQYAIPLKTPKNTPLETREGQLIIGDKALLAHKQYPYYYDLSEAWYAYTRLPFVFGVWMSAQSIDPAFIRALEQFQTRNLNCHMATIIARNEHPDYDLNQYYTEHIHYHLDADKQKGLDLFLSLTRNNDDAIPPIP